MNTRCDGLQESIFSAACMSILFHSAFLRSPNAKKKYHLCLLLGGGSLTAWLYYSNFRLVRVFEEQMKGHSNKDKELDGLKGLLSAASAKIRAEILVKAQLEQKSQPR